MADLRPDEHDGRGGAAAWAVLAALMTLAFFAGYGLRMMME